MRRIDFEYNVKAVVNFTRQELAILQSFSQSHYDGACQNASAPGGFLFGAMNKLILAPKATAVELSLTMHELQILSKIAEGENFYALAGGVPVLGVLGRQLSEVIGDVNAEWRRLNEAKGQ